MNPEIEHLANILSSLPGIGPRQARRIAFFIAGNEKRDIQEFVTTLDKVANLKRCNFCFRISTLNGSNLCEICSDESRDK